MVYQEFAAAKRDAAKVSTEIMRVQKDFLEQGDQGMRPLVLHDIAEAVGLHESTISRVTTQKFIDTRSVSTN